MRELRNRGSSAHGRAWLVKQGQLRTRTQQRWCHSKRCMSFFMRARYCWRKEKGKKENCCGGFSPNTVTCEFAVFIMTLYQDPFSVSILTPDAQKRLFKMSLSTMLFLHGCLFWLKCHCLCSFSWCLCWTFHTWGGLSKKTKQNKRKTLHAKKEKKNPTPSGALSCICTCKQLPSSHLACSLLLCGFYHRFIIFDFIWPGTVWERLWTYPCSFNGAGCLLVIVVLIIEHNKVHKVHSFCLGTRLWEGCN